RKGKIRFEKHSRPADVDGFHEALNQISAVGGDDGKSDGETLPPDSAIFIVGAEFFGHLHLRATSEFVHFPHTSILPASAPECNGRIEVKTIYWSIALYLPW